MKTQNWKFEKVAGPYKGPNSGLAWDGSGMLFSAVAEERVMRYDPATGKTNVGCRRMMLRDRNTFRSNLTAPSDLRQIYLGCVARGERLPIVRLAALVWPRS